MHTTRHDHFVTQVYIYTGERNKRSNIMHRRRGRSAYTYQLKKWPAANDWTITEIVKPIQITTT